jgi:hypothetical protein
MSRTVKAYYFMFAQLVVAFKQSCRWSCSSQQVDSMHVATGCLARLAVISERVTRVASTRQSALVRPLRAGLIFAALSVGACSFDQAWLQPRPQELGGEDWAEATALHVWAVLPEAPQWKKDVTRTGIKGTAVVVGEGQFLTACTLVEDERAIGLARVTKYYVAELVRRLADGACLLYAEGPPVNLPAWRRTAPPPGIAEPAILVTSIDPNEIDAQTTTIVGDRFSAGRVDGRLASAAFDRFGAVLGIAVVETGGGLRLIGSDALALTDLARLDPTSPIRSESNNERFTVAVAPEFSPPERRPAASEIEPAAGPRESDGGPVGIAIDRIEAVLSSLSSSAKSDKNRGRNAAGDNPSRENRGQGNKRRDDQGRDDRGRNDQDRDDRERDSRGRGNQDRGNSDRDDKGRSDQGQNNRGGNGKGRGDD